MSVVVAAVAVAVMMDAWAVDEQVMIGVTAFQTPIIFPLLWMTKRLTQQYHIGSVPHYPLIPPLASRLKSFVAIKDGQKNDRTGKLVEWLDEMEGSSSAVKIESNSQGLRGLYAKKAMRSGDVIVEIPYNAALLVGDTLRETIYDDFDDVPGSDGWSEEDFDDVYQGLNFLQSFTKDDYYESYVTTLPQVPSSGDEAGLTPDFWSKEFILGLQSPSLVKTILNRKEIVREVANKNNINEDELRWATWMIRSRRFTTWNMVDDPNTDEDGPMFGVFPVRRKKTEQIQGFLLPLIDMANHDHDPNAVLKITVNRWTREFDDTSSFALRALKPIKEGEQVTIKYGDGDRTSLDLLEKYGFFLEGNEADETIDWEELKPEFSTSLEEDESELAILEANSYESKTQVLSKTTNKLKTIVSKIQDYEPNFSAKLDGLHLVGSGMRQKMGIKIYAVAMYGTPAALDAESIDDLRNVARKFDIASPRTTFVLEMILQADADIIAEAISDSVQLRYGGSQADVHYLKSLIAEGVKEKLGQASKRCSLQFDCTEEGVGVSVDGAVQGVAKFNSLGSAFVDVFLDENTVSPSLVDNCLEREFIEVKGRAAEDSNMAEQTGQESKRTMLSLRILMKRLSNWKPTIREENDKVAGSSESRSANDAVVNGAILEHQDSFEIHSGVPDETDEDVNLLELDLTESAMDNIQRTLVDDVEFIEPDLSASASEVDDDAELLELDMSEVASNISSAEVVHEGERTQDSDLTGGAEKEYDTVAPMFPPGNGILTEDASTFNANAVEARIRQLEAEIKTEILRVNAQGDSAGTQGITVAGNPSSDPTIEVPVQVEDNQAKQKSEEEESLRANKEVAEKAAEEEKQRHEAVQSKAKLLKDKATGVAFDPKLEDGIYLVGVGVRKKAIINVYAVAMYSSPSPIEAIAPFPRGTNKKEAQLALRNAARTFDAFTPTTSFVLQMVFKADAQTIAGAIAEGVKPRYGGSVADVKELEGLIVDGVKSKGGQATKGTVFRFDCSMEGVSVSVDGMMQGMAKFAGMGSAFVDVFMDEKAVSPQLVDSCLGTWCGSGM
eukprot:CAMPEP_0181099468 /NCGR_PEP_ID=MMETSP1071-20121207/12675_1 /TAXON_ID=35127 /ORGANISM="Thalassiosira sp., Strain NH16" /LENGTH=1067 /DNA_ID=CAMNT_0023182131 /DNA_START=67 /DNA_END=3270 /DNA_ORIENTATION=+